MAKNVKTLEISSAAATFEKANTYVFAESLIRNRELVRSIPNFLKGLSYTEYDFTINFSRNNSP
jgi:hypothetical protein